MHVWMDAFAKRSMPLFPLGDRRAARPLIETTNPPYNNINTHAQQQALVGLATGHVGWQTRLGAAGLCWRVAEMLRCWPDDYGTQLSGAYFSVLVETEHGREEADEWM